MPQQPQRSRAVLTRVSGIRHFRLLAGGFAAAVFLITFATVGASPGGVPALSEVIGLSAEHGTTVRDAVHNAKDSVAEGDKVGPAVSEAACTAAHDRTTLPDGAQNAPGQADRESKDCTHPSDDADDSEDSDTTAASDATDSETTDADAPNHGQSVSKAVHDAKAGLEDGDKVGPAVSEAACTAAHDRTTLPDGAQNAPGQVGRDPKDCTHPSNVTGASDANGKATAPGQLKKNSD
jgi:hypothetical protein